MTLNWVVQPLAGAEEAQGAGWYHYTESGLDNVWLLGGVARHETPYGPGVAIDDVDGLNAAIAAWIVERKSYWHGRELKFLRKRLDLSQRRWPICWATRTSKYDAGRTTLRRCRAPHLGCCGCWCGSGRRRPTTERRSSSVGCLNTPSKQTP